MKSKTIKWLYLSFALGCWLHGQVPTLDIYWVDVEGGAATLIVTPAGESILVDSGEDVERDASRIHHIATKIAGLKGIDHVVSTHWHSDHYGGTFRLSRHMALRNFYDHGIPSDLPQDPKSLKLMGLYQDVTKGRSQVLKPGDILPLRQGLGSPELVITCIASDGKVTSRSLPGSPVNQECSKAQPGSPDPGENARSVALLLKYGNFTFFDGGDLTWVMEEQLVCPTNRVGEVDLFQINHHGLDSSNNPVLVGSIRPRVVVVNNAAKKGAEPNTMKTLQAISSIETVWQVHRNVRTSTESNTQPRFIANHEADCKAEFIKASVRPDGTFSVSIGEAGTRKDYSPRSH